MLWVIRSAISMGDTSRGDYQRSVAERKTAESLLEQTKQQSQQLELKAAHDRALVLQHARADAENKIMISNRNSLSVLHQQIEEKGGLKVEFHDGQTTDGIPEIVWSWTPFSNAVIKIYRNEGGILEDIEMVKKSANLIHVERSRADGEYIDREAANGKTYNFYAFIEARRTGYRPKEVKRDLPPEVSVGRVIDESGKEIKHFETVEPEEFDEELYFGFEYKRLTVTAPLSELQIRRQSLDERKALVDLKQYENELKEMEEELAFESGVIDEEGLETIVAAAKKQTLYKRRADELLNKIDNDPELDEEEKEIIRERVLSKVMR